MNARPVVTILTPVYNGEPYLAECIESVLAQTYGDWEYLIVDNASRDRTRSIADSFAAQDSRIRVCTNPRTVPVIENHNTAARKMSRHSRWCKFLSADDKLLPECLAQMVTLGERHPSVGLVSAYQLQGARLALGGLPYPSPVTPGRAIGRASLLGQLSVFGAPTAQLIRADFIRARERFFDESDLHADEAACYDVLKGSDFGFVHQVLTYARIHKASLTFAVARRLNTYLLGHLRILTTYGPVFLAPREYERVMQERLDAYYRFLVRALLTPERREIWRFHRDGLRTLGLPVSRLRLSRALLQQVGQVALAPGTELRKVFRLLRHADDDDLSWRQCWAPTGFEAVKGVGGAEPRRA